MEIEGEETSANWRRDTAVEDVDLGVATEIHPMPVFSLDDDSEKAGEDGTDG